MPRTYAKKKRRYRRRYNRRYRRKRNFRNRSTRTIVRNPSAFADRTLVKLSYNDLRQLFTASTATQDYIYRGNSVYDPDWSGIGNQPLGFDEWASVYSYYRVYASKLTVSFLSVGGGASNQICATCPNLTNSSFVSAVRIIETPYSKKRTLTSVSAKGDCFISNFQSTASIFGVDKQTVQSDDMYSAAVTNNPTNTWYWHVFAYDLGNGEANVYVVVNITYYCEFYRRKQLDIS